MYTSFPEKIKRHQVHHGVLDVVDLLFKRQLWREQTQLFLKHINNALKGLIFGWLKQKFHYVRPLRYCLDVSLSQSLPGLHLHLSQWEENNVHNVDNKTKGLCTMAIPLFFFFNWKKKYWICHVSRAHFMLKLIQSIISQLCWVCELSKQYWRGGPDTQWLLKEHTERVQENKSYCICSILVGMSVLHEHHVYIFKVQAARTWCHWNQIEFKVKAVSGTRGRL